MHLTSHMGKAGEESVGWGVGILIGFKYLQMKGLTAGPGGRQLWEAEQERMTSECLAERLKSLRRADQSPPLPVGNGRHFHKGTFPSQRETCVLPSSVALRDLSPTAVLGMFWRDMPHISGLQSLFLGLFSIYFVSSYQSSLSGLRGKNSTFEDCQKKKSKWSSTGHLQWRLEAMVNHSGLRHGQRNPRPGLWMCCPPQCRFLKHC